MRDDERISIDANELRLRKLPFIKALPYELMVEATKLIQRGADETLLHFWRDLKYRAYNGKPASVLEKATAAMKKKHPAFADDIDRWIQQ